MVASALEYELRHWSRLHPRHKLPRVVYVIPTGSNPSGERLYRFPVCCLCCC